MTAIRLVLLAALLSCSHLALAQTRTVNGWLILDMYWQGTCVMQKSNGATAFQFEPAHGKVRTHFSIFDQDATLVSAPVGMSLRVPGGAGPYNAFSADARAESSHKLTVGVYDGEAVLPWLEKATEFRLNTRDYSFVFPLSGQKEALVALYECLRAVPARQAAAAAEDEAFEEYFDEEEAGW